MWLALVGAAYAAGVAGWLLLPGDRPVPTAVWIVAFAGIFPVFGSAILLNKRYWRRGSASPVIWPAIWPAMDVLKRPAVFVRAIFAILVVLIVVTLVVVVLVPDSTVPPGDPGIVDGQYVLNNHGSLHVVSRQVYLHALEAGQLAFTSIAMVFYLVAGLVVGMTAERMTVGSHHAPTDR
jgi:hypothetical protein